jgi:hypothetical protein
MKILSIGADAKTIKGEKLGFVTGICYMAPAQIASKKTVCPFATVECTQACLYSAGRGSFTNVQKARIAKTLAWHKDPRAFLAQLETEIRALLKSADKSGMRPAVRLNGTSDIKFEDTGIMQKFPALQFYDYTKWPARLRDKLPSNYHITYSYTGLSLSAEFSAQWRDRGFNTAAVFSGGLPRQFLGRPVIDGDLSDLRFADPAGVK